MKEKLMAYAQEHGLYCLPDEPMRRHTTFHIGGTADAYFRMDSANALSELLAFVRQEKIPYFVLGKGSNLCVSDAGIRGAVISLHGMDALTQNGHEIVAEAGATLANLCCFAKERGLGGLSFAYGIPGSVGGALRMNAGAYGGCMKDVVSWADCMDENGRVMRLERKQMALDYRTSVFALKRWIILRAGFALTPEDPSVIGALMNDYMTRRKEKQPLNYPSAGSAFKRPQGYYAGQLIEQNGLKGCRVGDAQISEKHAGFIVNVGHATSRDVQALVARVVKTVENGSGVTLQPEILFVGEKA